VDRSTVSNAIRQIRPLLANRGFATPTEQWAATSFPDRGSTKILFQKVRNPCPRSVGTIPRNIAARP